MTIGKFFENLEKLGFTEEELAAANNRMVVRAFFRTDCVYGGPNDTEGGQWESRKAAFLVFKDSAKKSVFLDEKRVEQLVEELGTALKQGSNYEVDGRVLRLEMKTIVWQPAYVVEGVARDGLSKTFLLNTSTTDANNNIVAYKSDIHDWANRNIVDGILDKEWAESLATALNKRGVHFNEVSYTRNKSDGGTFTAKVLNPFFNVE